MYINHPVYIKDIQKTATINIEWSKLKHSSVLISGATGMIGTVLIDVLMERNLSYNDDIQIYALGRSTENAMDRFSNYMNLPCFKFIAGDINTAVKFNEKVDYLFHCASNTHPRAYSEDPVGTIMTNVVGTNNILQIALKSHAKRTVFLSSVEIYGQNRGDTELFNERYCGYIDCNTMRAGYPEGKRTGEALCQAYIQKYGLDIVIPRICRVFGPTMLKTDSKALAQFIKNAVRKEDIVLKSEGKQYFSYCYVCDVVSALLYVLCHGATGEAYNIADKGSDIYLKDLAQILATIAQTKVVFDVPDAIEAKGFSMASVARLDAEKIKRLGWSVTDSLEENLNKTVSLYRFLDGTKNF